MRAATNYAKTCGSLAAALSLGLSVLALIKQRDAIQCSLRSFALLYKEQLGGDRVTNCGRVAVLLTTLGLIVMSGGCGGRGGRNESKAAATQERHKHSVGGDASVVESERRRGDASAAAQPAADGGATDAAATDAADHRAWAGVSTGDEPASAAQEEVQSGADAGVASADAALPEQIIAEPEDDARHVFDQTELRAYNFVIAAEDLATIDLQPTAEQYVNGMVEVDGETYGPVAIRYKGSVGGFRPPCTTTGRSAEPGPKAGKCSMKVDFDRIDTTLRFHGLKKLNFHALNRDWSMLRDRLGYAMFREFGIAAPRAVHARLSINGRFEGLYAVVEQIDGRFTHSRFAQDGGDGNLYKEVWPTADMAEPYLSALHTNEDSDPNVDKMLRFAASISEGPEQSRTWLDQDYLFDYIAADRVITNDDGVFHWYCSFNHNYYWYEAQHSDRMWLVPWDLDSSFQNPSGPFVHINAPWNELAAECGCGQGRQMPASCDPLTGTWAADEETYDRAVDAFVAGPFAAPNVDAKLTRWIAQIDAVVQEAAGLNGAPSYAEWQQAVQELQAIIASSREHRGYDYSKPWQPSVPTSPRPESTP